MKLEEKECEERGESYGTIGLSGGSGIYEGYCEYGSRRA